MVGCNRIELEDLDKNGDHGSSGRRLMGPSKIDKKNHNMTAVPIKRYLILFTFMICYCLNTFQWLYLCSISDKLILYYNVSDLAIYSTAWIYMIAYILFMVPTLKLSKNFHLRSLIMMGTIGSSAAAATKLFGSHRDGGYYFIIAGQMMSAFAQLLLHSMPAQLAVSWFPNQMRTIKTVSLFSGNLGIALGYYIPNHMIRDSMNPKIIEDRLFEIHLAILLASVSMLVLVWMFFESKPQGHNQRFLKFEKCNGHAKIHPDVEHSNRVEDCADDLWKTIKQYRKEDEFFLLILCYGINIGIHIALSILMNHMITSSWERYGSSVGILGSLIFASSFVGSLVSVFFSLKMTRFQTGHALVYGINVILLMLVAVAIREQILQKYVLFSVFGFIMASYQVITYELANHNTYPKPENLAGILLDLSSMIFGIIFTYIGINFKDDYGCLPMSALFVFVTFVGFCISFFMKIEYKSYKENGDDYDDYPRHIYPGMTYRTNPMETEE